MMLLFFSTFFCLSVLADSSLYTTYSAAEMAEHKRMWMDAMRTNPKNLSDTTYQMERALRTVTGKDCDYIPKVCGAGEIFSDGELSYQLMHNGVKIVLNSYYGVQWITDVIYGLKGHHESQEEKCFYEVLQHMVDGATMIELGSFWGYYSLWFASVVRASRNYLIEPDPQRLAIGKKNFELNRKMATFIRGYVGLKVDREPDYRGADWISLDALIESRNIDHVDILHADVQGAEGAMLQTCVKSLHKIDYFFISTHGDQVHAQCIQFLQSNGYIIIAEHTHHESYSGDGLVVAKRAGVVGPEWIEIQKFGRN